jgi:DNA replication protein DnaC
MDEGMAVRFAVVPDLLAELRETFAPSSETTYNEAFERMRQVELLVLDDFGAQNDTPWVEEELFKLLNYRYNAFLPTVITTNKVGFIGIEDRLRSRLNDRRLVRTITFPYAKDYRQEDPTS